MTKRLISLVVCMFLVFTFSFGASSVNDVYYSNYPIMVNSKTYQPNLPILNYQGRTYVPLSELATTTGVDVTFKDNTIYLSTANKDVLVDTIYYLSLLDSQVDYIYSLMASLDNYKLWFVYSKGDTDRLIKLADMFAALFKYFDGSMEILDEYVSYLPMYVDDYEINEGLDYIKNQVTFVKTTSNTYREHLERNIMASNIENSLLDELKRADDEKNILKRGIVDLKLSALLKYREQ